MSTNLPFTGIFKVTCEYGRKGNWAAGYHTGIDLVGNDKTVYNVCNGKVVMARYYGSYGNCVKVKDDNNGNVYLFAHLASIKVRVGQKVSRTSKIGIMGATGNANGVHLHFEVRTPKDKYGEQYNPCDYLAIPNKVANNLNSNNYQIQNTQKFKQGEKVLLNIPVTDVKINGDFASVNSNGYVFEVHKSLVKDNKINEIGTVAYYYGEDLYMVQLFEGKNGRQFKCREKYMVKI